MAGQLYFVNRDQWRVWLERNHNKEKEVWLIHYKKHTGMSGIAYEDAVEEALCFGWIDGLLRSIDEDRYALRYSPRRKNSIWSETNRRRAERMVEQGQMTPAGLAKIRQAKESGEWYKAGARERLNVPPDLEQALALDKQASEKFKELTPSRKKQFLYWIASAKKEETRRRRIDELLQMVKENNSSTSS